MKNLIEQSKELSTTSFIVKDGVEYANYKILSVKISDGNDIIIYTIGRANQFSSHSSYISRNKGGAYRSLRRESWKLYNDLGKFEKAISRIENLAKKSSLEILSSTMF